MTHNRFEADPHLEQRIRERAYYLWDASGRPHGRDLEFWKQARELIAIEDSVWLDQPAPKPLRHDPQFEQRIRERAYYLWEADGAPQGHDLAYWERACELVGMEESAGAGLLPSPLANQGEVRATPSVARSRASKKSPGVNAGLITAREERRPLPGDPRDPPKRS